MYRLLVVLSLFAFILVISARSIFVCEHHPDDQVGSVLYHARAVCRYIGAENYEDAMNDGVPAVQN